ncbi:hypothetical protein WJX73_002588 [Symbiochloris irregularis]|uniref:Phycocyanobilin:ferredoxin oxidoreductase n=1 Tax=Symbiochloris irregularis TaxID=706552 RepID=A0AAW1NVQ9_9CHLO
MSLPSCSHKQLSLPERRTLLHTGSLLLCWRPKAHTELNISYHKHHVRPRAQRSCKASAAAPNVGKQPSEGVDLNPQEVMSRDEVISLVGLGSWRLRPFMAPAFETLGAHIEGAWRHLPLGSLQIFPVEPDLQYCDSADPEGKRRDSQEPPSPGPEKGAPGWPRLQMENRCYSTRAFRKMHLELAHRQDDLQVLHAVIFPRLEYDIPILSMDMVGKGNQVSLCIIDPCPVRLDRSIPGFFREITLHLQSQLGLSSNRQTPEWGKAIFSDLCLLMRPTSPQDLAGFLKYAIALHQAYLTSFANATPVVNNREARLAGIAASHQRYALHQRQNDRTRKVLQASFNPAFTERYMNEVLFDFHK